jgi:hypothetical protein
VHLLGGPVEDPAELLHRPRRLLVVGQMRQRQVAARCQRRQVAVQHVPRVVLVRHEVHHGGHQQPDRLAEVDQRPQIRVGQHARGIAQVTEDHPDQAPVGQQPARLLADHRVVVHVDDPALRVDQADHLVRVAHRRQPRPDIDELAHPAAGYPPRGPLMNPRLAQAQSWISGTSAMIRSAASRSTGK